MGNDSSSSHGGIKIALEKYTCNAGENVKGCIHISLKEPFSPSDLVLMFKGKEGGVWKPSGSSLVVPRLGKEVITKTKNVLFTWSEEISPGDLTIPFDFMTPSDLPGSFFYSFGEADSRNHITIEYYFKATLKSSSSKLKDKQAVHIIEPENYNREASIPNTINLVSFCCFKQGRISMDLKWVNDVYYQGGPPIECELEVDTTKSSVGVKGITVFIYAVMNISSISVTLQNIIDKTTYPITVPKGSVLNRENGGRFQFDLSAFPKKVEFFNLHSSSSNIITCKFYIYFFLETGLKCICWGDMPAYNSVFFVKSSGEVPAPVIQAPHGWQPTVFKQVSLTYKGEDELGTKGNRFNANKTGLDNKT